MAQRKQSKTVKSDAERSKGATSDGRDTLAKLRTHVEALDKRLTQAGKLTRSSVKALRTSFEVLNDRAGTVKDDAQNHKNLAHRVEQLSSHLNGLIDKTRKDVAHDLTLVMEDPRLETLSQALTNANRRLSRAEREQAGAIGQINEQIADLAMAVDKRLQREVRDREKGEAVLTKKIENVERETTHAVKTIGDKMVDISQELSSQNAQEILDRNREFEGYKSTISRRVEALEDDQRNLIPSLERQLLGLQTRLETIESADMPPSGINADKPPITQTFDPLPVAQANDPEPAEPSVQSAGVPGQADAFTPSEFVSLHSVAPPAIPYAGADAVANGVGETVAVSGTYTGAAQLYVPEEYIPQDYPPPELISTEQAATPPPPPMMASVPPPLTPALAAVSDTMDAARPGDPVVQKRKGGGGKDGGNGKLTIGMPVKMAALMVGAALVGLLSFKILTPLVFGAAKPDPQRAVQAVPAEPLGAPQIPQRQNFAEVERGGGAENPSLTQDAALPNQAIQTIATVGNYTDTIKAPDLGTAPDGLPSAQKLSLQAAAENGDPVAQYQLGLSHLEAGRDKQAVQFIRLAANQGQPAAQYRLGKMYEVGLGVGADGQTAMSLLERAAKGGNRMAMHDLGHYFATGAAGIKPDVTRAVTWFQQAAERGVLDSQFNLGVLYQGGSGVEQSLVDAYVWFSVAGAQGDVVATQRSTLVAKDMDAAGLAKAKARIRAFAPRPVNETANGVFKDLPWATPARPQSLSDVKIAQRLLNGLGYTTGAPDGAMGPKTRDAIVRFQRANGLPETGRASAALIEHLNLASGV